MSETPDERREKWHKAMADLARKYPHPTDGMTKEGRDAWHEEKRLESWAEAHEIEARVPGLDWGPSDEGYPPYGNGAPWQAEGWLGHRPFYARYRGNTAAITIFDRPYGRHSDGPRPNEVESCVVRTYREPAKEHEYDGTLNGVDEIVEFFERLVPLLAPTSEENPSHYMGMVAYMEQLSELTKLREEMKDD